MDFSSRTAMETCFIKRSWDMGFDNHLGQLSWKSLLETILDNSLCDNSLGELSWNNILQNSALELI